MAAFCDYCGEVITNYHTSVNPGPKAYNKLFNRIRMKQLKDKKIKGFFKKFFFYPKLPKELEHGSDLIFCNEEHYNLFKKKCVIKQEGVKDGS